MHILTACSICGGSASQPLILGQLRLACCQDCLVLIYDQLLRLKYPKPDPPPDPPKPDLPLDHYYCEVMQDAGGPAAKIITTGGL